MVDSVAWIQEFLKPATEPTTTQQPTTTKPIGLAAANGLETSYDRANNTIIIHDYLQNRHIAAVPLSKDNALEELRKHLTDDMIRASLKNIPPNLRQVELAFEKWLHTTDHRALHVILAAAVAQVHKQGEPLWFIYIAPTGGGKTEKIRALDDDGKLAYRLQRLTPKTIVSGKPGASDLAPRLDGKIMLITDMAPILQMRAEDKGEIWGQLRDLYDGYAGVDAGSGKNVKYSGLRVGMIAASTSAIDEQILIHQSLGTRELLIREDKVSDEELVAGKAVANNGLEKQMREELKTVVQSFIKNVPDDEPAPTPEIRNQIIAIACNLARMRTAVPADSYSGETRGLPVEELPTRVSKQLVRLYSCLKTLDPNYSDEQALALVAWVARSSIEPLRLKVLTGLNAYDGLKPQVFSAEKLAHELKVGYKTAYQKLNELYALGFVDSNLTEIEKFGRVLYVKSYSINAKGVDLLGKVLVELRPLNSPPRKGKKK